jgi:hypothetical protein
MNLRLLKEIPMSMTDPHLYAEMVATRYYHGDGNHLPKVREVVSKTLSILIESDPYSEERRDEYAGIPVERYVACAWLHDVSRNCSSHEGIARITIDRLIEFGFDDGIVEALRLIETDDTRAIRKSRNILAVAVKLAELLARKELKNRKSIDNLSRVFTRLSKQTKLRRRKTLAPRSTTKPFRLRELEKFLVAAPHTAEHRPH